MAFSTRTVICRGTGRKSIPYDAPATHRHHPLERKLLAHCFHVLDLVFQVLDGADVLLLLEQGAALRALELKISRLVEIKPGTGFRADEEQPLVGFIFHQALPELLKMVALEIGDKEANK